MLHLCCPQLQSRYSCHHSSRLSGISLFSGKLCHLPPFQVMHAYTLSSRRVIWSTQQVFLVQREALCKLWQRVYLEVPSWSRLNQELFRMVLNHQSILQSDSCPSTHLLSCGHPWRQQVEAYLMFHKGIWQMSRLRSYRPLVLCGRACLWLW